MNSAKPLSITSRLLFGGAFVAFGMFPALGYFNIGPLQATDINGPDWLGLAAGCTFIFAGLAVIAKGTWLENLFAILCMFTLASVGNWIGFGEGERICTASTILLGVGNIAPSSDLMCRIPFAYGAIVADAILIYFIIVLILPLTTHPEKYTKLRKFGEGLILFSLSPLLIVLLLTLLVRGLLSAFKIRMKTGRWPKNEGFFKKQKAKILLKKLRLKKLQSE